MNPDVVALTILCAGCPAGALLMAAAWAWTRSHKPTPARPTWRDMQPGLDATHKERR